MSIVNVNDPVERRLYAIKKLARQLVTDAETLGVVVTISTEPKEPLAMGHYAMAVDVRPARNID